MAQLGRFIDPIGPETLTAEQLDLKLGALMAQKELVLESEDFMEDFDAAIQLQKEINQIITRREALNAEDIHFDYDYWISLFF